MKKLIFLTVCILPLLSYSQSLTAFRDSIKGGYNFWLYAPAANCDSLKNDSIKSDSVISKKPLILFLHGQSLCGRNLSKVRRYGCIDAIEYGKEIDAYILAPQNPGGTWKPSKLLDILNWTTERYAIDTNRVYVIGMSLGGFGTLDFAGTYPEKVAAAMALCGGSTLSSLCGLTKVPLWIIHGTADRAVSVTQSQNVVNAMKNCGDTTLLRFDKLKNVNHSRLARVFYLDETYEWLFSHSLTDSVRSVNQDCAITVATLKDAFKDLHRNSGKFAVIDVKKETDDGSVSTADATWHVVKQGDTLGHIAIKYHTTVARLCANNNIKATGILRIGQKIKVM